MRQETLNEWLIYHRSLNLSSEDLITVIGRCDYFNIYENLDGYDSKEKASILLKEWNKIININYYFY